MPGTTLNAPAVTDSPFARPMTAAPLAVFSRPSASEGKVWLAARSVIRPFAANVTTLAGGNAPVPASSQTPPARMRVGPAHACGAVKRKLEFFVRFSVVIVTPCGSSSGCEFRAWNEALITSAEPALQPLSERNVTPCVPISARVTSPLMKSVYPPQRFSTMPPSKNRYISQLAFVVPFRSWLFWNRPPSRTFSVAVMFFWLLPAM